MFLHNINYNNFDIQLGDTLLNPLHLGKKFDAIVSNPPYSLKWVGKDNALLINDDRYSPAGILAPKNAADLAFTMHMLYHLKESGTCAIVEFPGVLYRSGAEKKIREYLLHNDHIYIDSIIQLPQNLFFGVSIATCIIVLRKERCNRKNVLFIDATKLKGKDGNKNYLRGFHKNDNANDMDTIVNAYINRENIKYFSKKVPIKEIVDNDYNLSVSSYIEQEDTREVIDINTVNMEIVDVLKRIRELQNFIDDLTAKNAI